MAVATKVKGILIENNGGPEVLNLKEFDVPSPKAGHAKVRVHAAGVNFIDIYQRRGTYHVPLPYTPGLEGAGVVEEVGEGVTDVKPGDRVAYTGQPGAYAQYCNVPADKLIALPEELSFEQGAAFPLQGMTAHYLINEYRKPKQGDTVLIHAAAGGMGLLLCQWAKHLGARVIGTVSNETKAGIARQAGCDDVIIYTERDFVAEVKTMTDNRGADLVIDGVGKSTFAGSLEAARLRGHVVIYGSASGPAEPIAPNMLQQRSLTLSGGSLFNYMQNREELLGRANDVLTGIRQGWLKLRIDHVLPLEKAAEAHQLLESRQSVGKVILNAS